jgi:hypothetical protein
VWCVVSKSLVQAYCIGVYTTAYQIQGLKLLGMKPEAMVQIKARSRGKNDVLGCLCLTR